VINEQDYFLKLMDLQIYLDKARMWIKPF